VDAGVDVVSHASLLVWEPTAQLPPYTARARGDFDGVSPTSDAIDRLLRRMASRGTILEPTLFVVSPQGQPSKSGEWAARVTARARALGVRIAAGTDGLIGNGENARPNLHEELALLVRHAGLTPLEAISAATSVAATALGVQDGRGVLAPGKAADLVILSRDPTADIRNTRSIEWVMKAGKRYGGPTP
jgi:imidazolonepropionase-like amidohydrolase